MKRRFRNLGLWLVCLWLGLLAFAAVFPEDVWYPFGVLIKMIPGTIFWPVLVLLEATDTESTFSLFVLYLIFAPLLFWLIGKGISLAATNLFPYRNGKAEP